MKNILKKILIALSFSLFLLPLDIAKANSEYKVTTYVGGIGCPHCSIVSPFLHSKVQESGLVMIEYEMYKNIANASIVNNLADNYGTGLGIPIVLFNKSNSETGDTPIKDNWDKMFNDSLPGEIFFPDGSSTTLDNLDLNDIRRYPRIYTKDRVAIRESVKDLTEDQNEMIKAFLLTEDINEAIKELKGESAKTKKVEYPGGILNYEQAISINGWLLQWDGPAIEGQGGTTTAEVTQNSDDNISIGKTILLALADSVNPCAISVLALMLVAIVTYNPGSRKQILLSGLAFIAAVIIMYLLYGFLIIKAFQFIQSIASIKLYIYKALGVGAIILGLLELKDYFFYKPGSLGTEMPLSLRPKVQKLISKITSPAGAFGLGLFVTLFLLPCTIGPYIILGGMVAQGGFISALPYLILYNLIFVLPMFIIVMIIFFGSKKVEDISTWKEKNIRKMHLIAGALILTMGILMLLGIF
jgi:cytochrome c biogenesis protein CcdA